MKTNARKTAPLGELIVAVFDNAARYSTDPREVSRLATEAVMNILGRARQTLTPPLPRTARIFAR